MSRLLPIAALILSGAALAAALLRPEPPMPASASSGSGHEDDVAALERRLELLEETTEHLELRVGELLKRPASPGADSAAIAPAGVAAELAQLRSEVRGMIAGEALQSEGGKAYLREAVKGVQEELENEERKERSERFAANQLKSQEAQKARWKKFVTEARLDYTQEQNLNRLLEVEATARRTVMDEVRAGTRSFSEVRGAIRATRETTDTAMKASLNAEQFQKYTEQRREGERGGGRQERTPR